MKCPTCQTDMSIMGCRVSDSPFHWCPNCGTIQPCDDTPAIVPAVLSRISPSAYLPVGAPMPALNDIAKEDEARDSMRRMREHILNTPVKSAEPEADRECIIEPHTYERAGAPNWGCMECGLPPENPIHTKKR